MNIDNTFAKLKEINDIIKSSGLDKSEPKLQLHELTMKIIRSPEITKMCLKLYKDNHNALAVETAFKLINNYVKDKSGLTSLDGMALMQKAFSPSNPKIKLNTLKTKSEQDEQLGYMNIFAGCMTGIRNPRAHEPNYQDSESQAFELLLLADHLMKKLKSSTNIV
jgi:uncharacterized protein (TIGR02391 family)